MKSILIATALAGCAHHHVCGVAAPVAAGSHVDIPAVLGAYQNFGATLSPDGARVLFRSDRGETAAAYVADVAHPDGPAREIAGGSERVASALFTRDGAHVVFRTDTGADENFHIFIADAADGTHVRDLTPDNPMWRDTPILPRARPDLMVYGARKPTDYASSIFVQDLAGGAPRAVYHESGPGTILDVTADAARALWWREAATGGHEVADIDLATGAMRPVSPRDGSPAMVTSAAYATGGDRIYVATDNGGETHVVEAIDPTGATVATYTQTDPPTADISAIVPSPAGDVVAIMVNAGNHSIVRLLDAHSLAKLRDVELPLGTHGLGTISETQVRLGGGTFADDGAHFTLSASIPGAPDEIYLVDTATGRAAPLRAEPRTGLAGLPAVATSIVDIPSFDAFSVPTNLHIPAHAAGARLPVMVWLHGGPDASTPLEWNAWNRVFTAGGFAIVEPNLRGSTGFGRAYARADHKEKRWDAMRDLERVNAWLRAQPWCDPARIAVAGGSFGGYYTLMALAHQPALWSAGIDLAGPSDLEELLGGGSAARRYVAMVGDPNDPADLKIIRALSPIHAADKVVAPLFVYQGANDARVAPDQATSMVDVLRARRIRLDVMTPADEGHTVAKRANERELLSRILAFLAPS